MAVDSALFWVLAVPGAGSVVTAAVLGVRGRRASPDVFEAVEEPITAIRKVVEALEAADAIVYADFHRGEVHAHRSLAGSASDEANLSDVTMFLSITGSFEPYEERDGSDEDYLRLKAPYPGGGAHVRVKIARSGLRGNDVALERDSAFWGRVLGKVENWDEPDRVLKMWAMAIFR